MIIDLTLGFSLIPTVLLPSLLTQEHKARSFCETSQNTVEICSLHIDVMLLSFFCSLVYLFMEIIKYLGQSLLLLVNY